MVVGSNIERRIMTVEEIGQIGLVVRHAADDSCWKLATGSFNSDLPIMQDSEI